MAGTGEGKNGGKKQSKWGKGKTDPDTWWKKGDPSPNPKGRPKGSKNQKTLYQEAFGAKVIATIDGVDKEMTKQELGYHQVANKSAAGELKAFLIQKELDEKFDPVEVAPPTPEESVADWHTFEAFLELRETFQVFAKEQAEEAAQAAATAEDDDDEEEDGDEQDSADDEDDGDE